MSFLKRLFSTKADGLGFNLAHQRNFRWKSRAKKAVRLGIRFGGLQHELDPIIGDFGAGDLKVKARLEKSWGAGASFTYIAYDLNPQSPEVKAIDFNHDFPREDFDFVFCLGVLEYLTDPASFLAQLGKTSKTACVSMIVSDSGSFTPEQVRELGWLNHFSSSTFEGLLGAAGLVILHRCTINRGKTGLWVVAQSSDRNECQVPPASPPARQVV